MQTVIKYKMDSVIYFASDTANYIYILKSGNVVLNSIDNESNKLISKQIKAGELFGVKSVLGNYPRNETAIAISDATVYAFDQKAFEDFSIKNPRIILQMIKIYSKDLRKLHKQTETLITKNAEKNNEEKIKFENQEEFTNDDGLFSVAEAFFKSEHYAICTEVARRYNKLYSNGKHQREINELLLHCKGRTNASFSVKKSEEPQFDVSSEALKQAIQAENENEYAKAYHAYSELFKSENTDEATLSIIGAARCLVKLEKYTEAIKLLSLTIKRNSESEKLAEMLFLIGKSYEKLGQSDKADAFFDKSEQVKTERTGDKEVHINDESQSNFSRFAKYFKKGELIFAEYEPGSSFYLIQSGQVQLIKAVNGYEKNLDILQEKEFFGEMAILDNSPRSASAIAYEDVKLLEFNKQNFELLIHGNPEIALVLLKTFIRRIYVQKRRYKVLTVKDKRVRIADVFLMLDETLSNLDRSSEMRIFEISLDDLARWASLTVAEINENIAKLIDQNYIEVFDDRIVIQNMTLLKRFVQARLPNKNE